MADFDYSPGQNIKNLFSSESANVDAVVGQSSDSEIVPDNPGPAVAGRTPILGQARRQSDKEIPVLRDRIGKMVD